MQLDAWAVGELCMASDIHRSTNLAPSFFFVVKIRKTKGGNQMSFQRKNIKVWDPNWVNLNNKADHVAAKEHHPGLGIDFFCCCFVAGLKKHVGPSGQPLGSLNGSTGPSGSGGPHNNNNTNNHNNNNMGTTSGAGPSHPHTPSPNNHPSGGGGGGGAPTPQQHSSTSSVSPKTFHFEGLLTGKRKSPMLNLITIA